MESANSHRSKSTHGVNQTGRFCFERTSFNCIASSGVEKKIKLWSPFDITNDDVDKRGPSFSRRIHRREDHSWMVTNSSNLIDCEHESVEENPKMLAFFDSLVQRDLSSDETTETENEQQRLAFEEELASAHDSSDSSISSTTDDIDTVIAKKREVISIKKRMKNSSNRRANRTKTGNGSTRLSSSQENSSSEQHDKQTIEFETSEVLGLISNSSNSSSSSSSSDSEPTRVELSGQYETTDTASTSYNTVWTVNTASNSGTVRTAYDVNQTSTASFDFSGIVNIASNSNTMRTALKLPETILNNDSDIDKNMQNEIMQALKTEIQENSNSNVQQNLSEKPSNSGSQNLSEEYSNGAQNLSEHKNSSDTDSESDTDQTTARQLMFKKSKKRQRKVLSDSELKFDKDKLPYHIQGRRNRGCRGRGAIPSPPLQISAESGAKPVTSKDLVIPPAPIFKKTF